MSLSKFRIADISPVVLRSDSGIHRHPPRQKDKQENDYIERFDAHTLFYDVFEDHDGVVFSGPPMRNLRNVLRVARIELYGRSVVQPDAFKDGWKTQRSKIKLPPQEVYYSESKTFSIDVGRIQSRGIIRRNESELFKGKKVLITLSKDNDLQWIKDWATYYSVEHGIDSVLFYDNNSSQYSVTQILETLKSVSGIKQGIVVPWNFKYGPGAGPKKEWDSNYCQYGVLEHARRRFLRESSMVINVDIDELVVSEDASSLFDELNESENGALRFSGAWVETVGQSDREAKLPRFVDFKYRDSRKQKSLEKWALIPKRIPEKFQWQVHGLGGGFNVPISGKFIHRHYLGINSNWKYDRTKTTAYDEEHHFLDEKLIAALSRSFPEDIGT
ncbi:glycosyltransferase family 92 protein [Glutamicibacter arilaitensis]|uniref:glycosyltransferase family 92 protein n=1 Tax=Glutamicibacter arilaitensis TaxID=256701 RepID=UPI003FD052E6